MLSKPGLGVYLVASWPSKDTYEKAIRGLEGIADFFELGLPSKNPKYDGPFIRKAHREAGEPLWLRPQAPTYIMTYWEEHRGNLDGLFTLAAEIRARGVLAPDLLIDFPEELELYLKYAREYALAPAFFVPGKFPHWLVKRLTSAEPDFIYLGLYAATGVELPVYVERNVKIIRQLAGDVYIVAGFAIDSPSKAARLIEAGADGVVVGTAFMRRLQNSVDSALSFLKSIKEALK